MKKFVIIFILAFMCFVMLMITLLHPIGMRIDILKDYKQLLSDPESVIRLESISPIKTWEHYIADDVISIGYASFSFPFDEIFEIGEENKRVFIDSDKAKVQFVFSLLDDFPDDSESSESNLPALVYKGETVKVRDDKYKKYDIALNKFELSIPSYEFHKEIHKLKPKPILSLLFMDFDDLYLYERLLEMKNSNLWGGKVFLFETDSLKGMVERLDRMEEKHNYANCYMVLAWDLENKIYQLVQIISYMDEITEDEIRRFFSSLSYDMDVIESNSDNLKPIILKALQKSEYYSPAVGVEYKESPSAAE